MGGISAYSATAALSSFQSYKPFLNHRHHQRSSLVPHSIGTPFLKLTASEIPQSRTLQRTRLQCNFSAGGDSRGSDDSGNVLDAFFLGKALAEALNERIESTVGEILSNLGRFQAEQQKQVQEFQVEVLERAKKAKEKAAREAMGAQGLVPNSSTAISDSVNDGINSASASATNVTTPSSSARQPNSSISTSSSHLDSEDPAAGVTDVE